MTEPAHADEGFRRETRAWIAANFPSSLAHKDPVPLRHHPELAAREPDFAIWCERIAAKGWAVPTWPVEFGGAGLSAGQAKITAEELGAIGAFDPLRSNGSVMLGPTVLEFGTDAQKQRYLPPIARGEERWCQGFSEPGAGSDLASLQTRADDRGDHWLVNGQKIWTSGANHSDWCFALVRTDVASKQGGISFLLIDMRSSGVEARPITLINGSTHFCEVFFTDVEVPKANILGEVNQGWMVAKRLMQYERAGLSEGRGEGASLLDMARDYGGVDADGRLADQDLRGRLIRHVMRAQAFTWTLERKAAEAKASGSLPNDTSALKNIGSAVSQAHAQLACEILGNQGLGWEGQGFTDAETAVTRNWLYSRAFSIYGGSHEIQNNITAKRVLDLPDR